jgi:hypothetical protein
MKNIHVISGLLLVAVSVLSNCAAPGPDPYLTYIEQRKAMIAQMPDGPAKAEAYDKLIQEIDRERQTRAMELSAISQAQMAEPKPTPYVNPFPTPIQVQIVPNPYGY